MDVDQDGLVDYDDWLCFFRRHGHWHEAWLDRLVVTVLECMLRSGRSAVQLFVERMDTPPAWAYTPSSVPEHSELAFGHVPPHSQPSSEVAEQARAMDSTAGVADVAPQRSDADSAPPLPEEVICGATFYFLSLLNDECNDNWKHESVETGYETISSHRPDETGDCSKYFK